MNIKTKIMDRILKEHPNLDRFDYETHKTVLEEIQKEIDCLENKIMILSEELSNFKLFDKK